MTLEKKKARSDLLEKFKIINGCYNFSQICSLHYDEGQRRVIQRSCITYSRLDVMRFVFSNRVIDSWNALSGACVNSTTVKQFKNCFKHQLQLETRSSF